MYNMTIHPFCDLISITDMDLDEDRVSESLMLTFKNITDHSLLSTNLNCHLALIYPSFTSRQCHWTCLTDTTLSDKVTRRRESLPLFGQLCC